MKIDVCAGVAWQGATIAIELVPSSNMARSVRDISWVDQGTSKMRLLSPVLALAFSTSVALAADVSPLSPGAPAGVKHAQMDGPPVYILAGAGALALGIALIASDHSNGAPTSGPSGTITASSTSATF